MQIIWPCARANKSDSQGGTKESGSYQALLVIPMHDSLKSTDLVQSGGINLT